MLTTFSEILKFPAFSDFNVILATSHHAGYDNYKSFFDFGKEKCTFKNLNGPTILLSHLWINPGNTQPYSIRLVPVDIVCFYLFRVLICGMSCLVSLDYVDLQSGDTLINIIENILYLSYRCQSK